MKSIRYSNAILAAALAVIAIGAITATNLHGQGGQQDFSKVQIKATKLSGNFSTLEGQGGTIGVLSGPDGVFMVDTQFAPLTEKIVAAVKQITPNPIRFAVNTHLHGDHSGGNENLAKLGVFVISRDELREGLAHPAPDRARRSRYSCSFHGFAENDLQGQDDASYERRRNPAHRDPGSAHQRRYDDPLREQRHPDDRRLLSRRRVSVRRPE